MEVSFLDFSDTPTGERYFSSSGNVFLNEFYIPYGGDGFSVLRKPFSLFFLQVEAVAEINGPFF